MPVDHYENFPVASLLLPPSLRRPIAALYHFARAADDLADEGEAPPETRLAALDAFRRELDVIAAGATPSHPLFVALAETIRQHALPLDCCYDLLDAFAQDVVKTRYADYAELLDYARRSANPVGRLVLCLATTPSSLDLEQSDAICSALQFINFWQDVAIDWNKGRIYLPEEDMRRFGVSEADLARAVTEPGALPESLRALLAFEVDRTRALMHSGAPLALRLPGRLGWEIRLTVQGGLRILDKLVARRYDAFRHRPRLRAPDWIIIAYKALGFRQYL